VKISLAENQVRFAVNENLEIVSRLIEGNFPNYEQIIPNQFITKAEVETNHFINALKMTSLFAKEVANNIKLNLQPQKGIIIEAQDSQIGASTAQLRANVEGQSSRIAFNAKFILDGLAAVGANKVNFEISGKLSPAKISPIDSSNYLYIIMPLRIEE
jgi:DNA polymerase-3 subunit beta